MKALASAEKEKKGKAPHAINAEKTNNVQLVAIDSDTLSKASNVSAFPQGVTKPLIVSQYLAPREPDSQPQQEAAANIFNAARLPASNFPHVLLALALITLGLCIWLATQFFPVNSSSTHLLVADHATLPKHEPPVAEQNFSATPIAQVENHTSKEQQKDVPDRLSEKTSQPRESVAANIVTESTTEPAEPLLKASSVETRDEAPATNNARQNSLQLSHTKSTTGIEPTLMAAYQAFNQGELSQAQHLYRQALQKDVRNVDALLGMAAIAQRQARNSDALGWYQKVLEVDPAQPFALSAMVGLQPALDSDSQINHLKNLIAQQPENAQFHASLGNLYAEQNRWQEAQASYFEAVRFAPQSAAFLFNLAVSLEHLNQPQLALMQYQRALQLVERTSTTSPDPLILKSRILALQPAS